MRLLTRMALPRLVLLSFLAALPPSNVVADRAFGSHVCKACAVAFAVGASIVEGGPAGTPQDPERLRVLEEEVSMLKAHLAKLGSPGPSSAFAQQERQQQPPAGAPVGIDASVGVEESSPSPSAGDALQAEESRGLEHIAIDLASELAELPGGELLWELAMLGTLGAVVYFVSHQYFAIRDEGATPLSAWHSWAACRIEQVTSASASMASSASTMIFGRGATGESEVVVRQERAAPLPSLQVEERQRRPPEDKTMRGEEVQASSSDKGKSEDTGQEEEEDEAKEEQGHGNKEEEEEDEEEEEEEAPKQPVKSRGASETVKRQDVRRQPPQQQRQQPQRRVRQQHSGKGASTQKAAGNKEDEELAALLAESRAARRLQWISAVTELRAALWSLVPQAWLGKRTADSEAAAAEELEGSREDRRPAANKRGRQQPPQPRGRRSVGTDGSSSRARAAAVNGAKTSAGSKWALRSIPCSWPMVLSIGVMLLAILGQYAVRPPRSASSDPLIGSTSGAASTKAKQETLEALKRERGRLSLRLALLELERFQKEAGEVVEDLSARSDEAIVEADEASKIRNFIKDAANLREALSEVAPEDFPEVEESYKSLSGHWTRKLASLRARLRAGGAGGTCSADESGATCGEG